MSLNSIIRNAVAVANRITDDLQGDILHSAWIGQDGFGKPTYGRRVSGLDITGSFDTIDVPAVRRAVIEQKQRIRDVQGRIVMTFVHLTFVGPIPVNGMSSERKEAVDPRDVMVLPDGTTGPIVDVAGVVDTETNLMYAVEVWLGDTTSARGGGGAQ